MRPCIRKAFDWLDLLSEKQAQWAWFILLWCGGLASVALLGYIIRWMMGIQS